MRAVLNLNYQNTEIVVPLIQVTAEKVYETEGRIEPLAEDNYSPGGVVDSNCNSQSVFDTTPMNQRYEQQPAKGQKGPAQAFSNSIFDFQKTASI